MFTDRAFWLAAAERAVKTFAQALLALIGTDLVAVTALDWPQMLAVAATAALASLLTSVASDKAGPNAGPSLTTETVEGRHAA